LIHPASWAGCLVGCSAAITGLKDAAEIMKRLDVGAVPVCDNDRLVGMVTDRDIVTVLRLRGVIPRLQR
jgi:CBS domain-containing protein